VPWSAVAYAGCFPAANLSTGEPCVLPKAEHHADTAPASNQAYTRGLRLG
jgi:hypothetical protein